VTRKFPSLLLLACRALLVAGVFSCALPAAIGAEDSEPDAPQLADKTIDSFQKLQPLLDAKDWDGAIALLRGVLSGVDPESRDTALILDTVAKLEIQKDDAPKAIEAWETALRLSDAHPNYFKQKDKLELVLSLAQNYSQLGSTTKDTVLARESFSKAADYIHRWLGATTSPTFEAQYFYAQVLYSQATANEKKIDKDLLRQAEQAAQKALHMQTFPKEGLYILVKAIYQQLDDMEASAKYLELLVRQSPDKDSSWQELWAVYMNLAAANDKDEDRSRQYYVRAINAMERAQSYGKMKANKDNYNLVTMYYTLGQFAEVTDLLHAGLTSGHIDSTIKNWQLLSYSYQQMDAPLRAASALKEAEALFPDSGEIDFDIAQIYLQLENSEDAYKYAAAATAKGNVEKPFNLYQMLAYSAYELEKYPEALVAVNKAFEFPQGKNNRQLTALKRIVLRSLKVQQDAAAPASNATQ